MEQHHTNNYDYLKKIKELDQATFFCFNESSHKLPVAIVRHMEFVDENTVQFDCNHFPLVEKTWDVFAAELHCYKKGMPYSFVLHGIAIFSDFASGKITFTIQHVESFDPTAEEENRHTILTMITRPAKYIAQVSTSIINSFWKKDGDLNVSKAAA